MSNDATHDITGYVITIGGYRLTGFADADAFDFTAGADRFSMLVGNYGLGAWARINNRSATGNFYLMATSTDNAVLQALLLADDAPGGVLVPMLIMQGDFNLDDATAGGFVAAASIRLMRVPDVARGASVPTTTWQWGTTRLYTGQAGMASTPFADTVAIAKAILAESSRRQQPV